MMALADWVEILDAHDKKYGEEPRCVFELQPSEVDRLRHDLITSSPTIRVMVYGIGGKHPEEFMGCAYDPTTALNLLKLLRLTGSHSCSLHGTVLLPGVSKEFSGEVGIIYAENFFLAAKRGEKVDCFV